MRNKGVGIRAGVSGAALCLGLCMAASTAHAQIATSAPQPVPGRNSPSAIGTPEVATPAEQPGEIVVTGSRILRRDYVAASPITTASGEALRTVANVTVDQALAQLPQFTGITGQTQIYSGLGSTGAATLNVRNLGSSRNLVLLDGRRIQPATTNFAVDTNVIPEALIDGVEIITGGASATYGSDAVAGVVNFKIKRNFKGVELNAKAGTSERGDYLTRDVNLTAGTTMGDGRGNFVVSVGYSKRDPVFQRDVPFYRRAFATGVGGTSFLATGYYLAAFDAAAGGPNWVGFPGSPSNVGFNLDHSTLFNPANGAGYTSGLFPQNPAYARNSAGAIVYNSNATEGYATTPLQRYTAFVSGDYEISDAATVYVQGLFADTRVNTDYIAPAATNSWSVAIPRDGAHPIPASLASLLDSRGVPGAAWPYGTSITIFGAPRTRNDTQVYQITAGVRGKTGLGDWTYDVYGSHGRATIDSIGEGGYLLYTRWRQLLQASNYGEGFNDGAGGHCTSGVSPFIDQSAVSQDCRDYLNYRYKNRLSQDQDLVEADLQGELFDLPAGEARLAVGAAYRRNTLDNAVDPAFEPSPITGNGTSSLINTFAINSTSGKQEVKELYGEALLPLLKDLPLVKRLELGLGYRYSDYRLSGGVQAYKAEANWTVFDALRLRGGYQRAVRAPNVTELFGGAQSTLVLPAFDPCATSGPAAVPTRGSYGNIPSNPDRAQVQGLCAAMTSGEAPGLFTGNFQSAGVPVLVGQLSGNPSLNPEKADTFTAGAVATLNRLPLGARLSLSVDYYNIRISDAIVALDANQTTQLCFNFFGTNPTYAADYDFCRLAPRQSVSGNPNPVLTPYQNQGGIRTDGIDFTFDLTVPVAAGRLGLNANVNYLNHFKQSFSKGLPFVDYADTITSSNAYFRVRSLVTLSYQADDVSVGVRWKHLPSARDASCITVCQAPHTRAYNVYNLFGSLDVARSLRLTFGIDNLLNAAPRVVGGLLNNSNFGEYDLVGRQFYVAARLRF